MRVTGLAAIDQRQHRAAQGFGAADRLVTGDCAHRSGDEFAKMLAKQAHEAMSNDKA